VSNVGFGSIKKAIEPVFGTLANSTKRTDALSFGSILDTLHANWINGADLGDQKAKAKSQLKLRLNSANAADYAAATSVPADTLKDIAGLVNQGQTLADPVQADVFGRFDLALTALLDEGYERADQRYRNACKLLAGVFSIVIAVFAGLLYAQTKANPPLPHVDYWFTPDMWKAFIAGALATPISPIAKDLTTALAAGADVMQKIQKKS
jgi:hypothetical protein